MTEYNLEVALASERIGPALRAVLGVLLKGPKPQPELVEIGAAAGGIQAKTMVEQFRQLRNGGYLWAKGRGGKHWREREWGLTPFGEDLARSLG